MAASGEPEKVDLASPDLAAGYREAFAAAFPGVLADGVLDVERLAELLDVDVAGLAEGKERYGLMWAGKSEAVRSLLTPSHATLVPDFERSIDFDTAQNVFIEGDNLEVLKLLQKAYNDKVKLIYIDPPYNTGNDFVYNDDFSDGLRGYLEYTGQVDDEGNRTSANAETQGRRHSKWLSMIFPRLVLARNLLTQDGVLVVSIDANECHNLRAILDEVFGEECFLNAFTWVSNLKGRQLSPVGAARTHEYLLVYARDADCAPPFRGSMAQLSQLMPAIYKSSAYTVKRDVKGEYVTKNELYNTNSKFNEKTAPTMVFRIHYNPTTSEVRVTDVDDGTTYDGFACAMPHANARPGVKWHAWRWSRAKVVADAEDLEFVVNGDELRIWTKVRDVDGTAVKDIVLGPSTATGIADLEALGLQRVFDAPKPVALLQMLIRATTNGDDLVADFFAGSGSTGHAVMRENARDGGRRRWLMVNLPEPVRPDSEAATLGLERVSDILRLRIAKAMQGEADSGKLGIRDFSLGDSHFRQSEPLGDSAVLSLEAATLRGEVSDGVISQVLLSEGVRLDEPWAREICAGANCVVAGGVAVVADTNVTAEVVAAAFGLNARLVVFLEDGFAGRDALKANAVTNAKNLGITMKTV